MKQLKFLKTISCEGKPIWYQNCSYEVISEGASTQGRQMYKLFCEDLKLRGIDANLANNFFKVIEMPEQEIKEENNEVKVKASTTKKSTSKKKKSTAK